MNFSVLLSVYHKEDPLFLAQALNSIEIQTLKPNEIVIVKDGPLTSELDQVITQYAQNTHIAYKVIPIQKNVGLGQALNEGLRHCHYEWVARMDTDDIALPDRFKKQIAYLRQYPKIDILGSWICEFENEPSHCNRKRRVPSAHHEIISYAKYRNPMNHMTVIFKKSAVEEAGGYLPLNSFEDYYLWMRMLKKGKIFANLSEVTVHARAGREMIKRRQGWRYAKDEMALGRKAYSLGFWSLVDIVRNSFIRILPRLLPVIVVEKVYNSLRK
ncbi:MAG: glycosyltransferase [Sulfurovum sp.]|nr:glycosyltransferase [Sulfurovum sp.]MCB4744203.1 glycosyltransferase [Sulfurovum sp.]MCB4745581.1 glycosyltransferase [Sulfurovum sp.]MCB4747840.1 glycosyltransferase [Sulfurovum sp.]MCB4749204.1 glycosyltransferase [Sulfurovum sp.]